MTQQATTPVIVTNSTAMKHRAIAAIREMKAEKVYLYLDHDSSGKELTAYFSKELQGLQVLDKSCLYTGHNDFNDWLSNQT